jgi:hypothetical protein
VFRRQHAEFTDGFLSEESSSAMQAHLETCPDCAMRDVRVRRSLLALQVLRTIEPSADFRRRLYERLAQELPDVPVTRPSGVRWGVAGVLVAASLVLLAIGGARTGLHLANPVPRIPMLALSPSGMAPSDVAPGSVAPSSVALAGPAPTLASIQPAPTPVPIEPARPSARPTPRFEAVASAGSMRRVSAPRASLARPTLQAVRLQTTSYLGQ